MEADELLYTPQQQAVLAILPMISGPLSVMGSAVIIFHVFHQKKRHTYHRLLLSMSLLDIVCSSVLSLSSVLVSRGTEGFRFTMGNNTTCGVSAFITMMSLSFPIYSASLAIYFLLTIKYEMEHSVLTRRVEPFMHFFAILHPLTLASYAVSIGFFAPNFVDATFCWYGYGCSESDEECMAEQDALPFTRVVNIFGTTVLVGAIVSIVVSMTAVYLHIRAKEHVLQQHLNGMHHVVPGDEHVAKRSRQTATQALLYSGFWCISADSWACFGSRNDPCLRIQRNTRKPGLLFLVGDSW